MKKIHNNLSFHKFTLFLLLLLLFWEVMVDVNSDDKYMENNATKIDNYKRSGFTVGSTRAIIVDLF